MTNSTITGNTYRTEDYTIFKRLEGNRPILALRVNKIIKSISKYGYIYNPIVVNEKYEVIDGQGRLEALQFLKLPVDFVIAHGAGLRECIALNASTTKWSSMDFIESYCEAGNENYSRLKAIIEAFPNLKLNVKILISTGRSSVPTASIQDGRLIIDEDSLETIYSDLSYVNEFVPYGCKMTGRQEYFYHAIAFAHHCGIDEERLLRVVGNSKIPTLSSAKDAMNFLSDIYNKGLKDPTKRIYLHPRYETEMCDKFGWYGSKWGSNDNEDEDEE